MGMGWAGGALDQVNHIFRGIHDNYDPAIHWMHDTWHQIGGNNIPDQPGLHSLASGIEKKPANYAAAILAAIYGGAAAAGNGAGGAGGTAGGAGDATGSLYGPSAGIGEVGTSGGMGIGESGASGSLYGADAGISGTGGTSSLFGGGSAGDFGAGMSGGSFAGGAQNVGMGNLAGGGANQYQQLAGKMLSNYGQSKSNAGQAQEVPIDSSGQPAYPAQPSAAAAQGYSALGRRSQYGAPTIPEGMAYNDPNNPTMITNSMNPYALNLPQNTAGLGGGLYAMGATNAR